MEGVIDEFQFQLGSSVEKECISIMFVIEVFCIVFVFQFFVEISYADKRTFRIINTILITK